MITRDKALIERIFLEHYQNIFGAERDIRGGFEIRFLPLMPKLDDGVKAGLEVPISAHEIEKAIDELQIGKSPVPDGLSAAFYKAFKSLVAKVLYRFLAELYKEKELTLSFQRTHIVLIPKGDDPVKALSVGSHRTISLANVDCKMLMKVLARRLQNRIKVIVGPHQTCGIKSRTITTNTCVASSILECCDATRDRVAMLQLDL